jgi:hypothetical protein
MSVFDREDQQFLEDFKRVIRTMEGRRFVYAFMNKLGTYGNPFNADPLASGYNAGIRSVGVDLLDVFMIDRFLKETYLLMLKENIMVDAVDPQENEDAAI